MFFNAWLNYFSRICTVLAYLGLLCPAIFFFPWVFNAHWLPVNEELDWLNFTRIRLFLRNSAFKEFFFFRKMKRSISVSMCTDWSYHMEGSLLTCWVSHMEFSRYINWVYYTVGFSVHCLGLLYGRVLCILSEPVIWHIAWIYYMDIFPGWECHMEASINARGACYMEVSKYTS